MINNSKQTEKISKLPIDVEKLKEFFAENLEEVPKEKYGLSWAGKVNAKKEALTPTAKTLNPQEKESKNWDETENVFIEGDNLEALKLLQRKYFEKIKMIYIDPPYNTGKDFIYKDNFARSAKEELEASGEMAEGALLTTNARTNGRFHSDWLNMMYSRLFLAHKLLKDDGVIFVSIDDNEVANLRLLMDEIFGEENFVVSIIWEKRFTRSNNSKTFATLTEYVLCYRKSDLLEEIKGPRDKKADSTYSNPDNDLRGIWTSVSYVNPATKEQRPNLSYELTNPITGKKVIHPTHAWKFEKKKYELHQKENRLYWGKDGHNKYPRLKRFLSEMNDRMVPVNFWNRNDTGTTDEASKRLGELMTNINIFDFPKPIGLIKKAMRLGTGNNDIVLDFFAGSGTTAHAVMDLNAEDGGNRKYILVQLDEEVDEKSEAGKAGYKNIAEIARERIRRAGDKILEDKKEELEKREKSLDVGFRSFKISNSNYRQWEKSDFDMFEEKLLEQAQLFVDKPLIDNYRTIDVVFETIVKEGFALSSKISSEQDGKKWKIQDGERKMIVDFGDKVKFEDVEKMKLNENDFFVCFDSALTDNDKINITKSVNLKVV